MTTLLIATILTAQSPSDPPQTPAPRYYFLLFGGQSVPYVPRTAHTWATFVKATTLPGGRTVVEPLTISWLPAEGPVHPLRLRSVPGKNHSLEETFDIYAKNNGQVSMWGPYEIDAARYELAALQANMLNANEIRYRVLDSLGRNRTVANCTHAITFADPNLQWLRQPVPVGYGEPGTSKLAAKYMKSGAFIRSETHDWLLPVLGLDKLPAIRREPGEQIPRQW